MRKKSLSALYATTVKIIDEFISIVKAYQQCSIELAEYEGMEVEIGGVSHYVDVCSEPEFDLRVHQLFDLRYPDFYSCDWGVLVTSNNPPENETPMQLATRINNTLIHQELINNWVKLNKMVNGRRAEVVVHLMTELEYQIEQSLPVNSILTSDLLTCVKTNNSEALMDNYGTAMVWASLTSYTIKQLERKRIKDKND